MLRRLPLFLALALVVPATASAAGQRDPSFGSGGELRLAGEPIRALARQADGRLVLASERRVYRLTAHGALDLTFGTSGFVTPPGADRLRALVLQPDGRIVVGGAAGGKATLYRFSDLGQPDAAFGTAGRVTLTTTTATEQVNALALTADGKLVAAGDGKLVAAGDGGGDAIVWRRRAHDGAADPNFNAGGRLAVAFAAGATETATGVAVQPNGRIVLVGATAANAYVARLHPVGGLDAAFAGAGKQQLDLGGTETASGVSLQLDGKLVVAGRTSVGSNGVVWRLLADGQPDDTFNDAGVQFVDLDGNETIAATTQQADGKLLLVGATTAEGLVQRLSATGRPDPTFAGGVPGSLSSAVVQPDTNLVVAGSAGGDGVVYRLLGDPIPVTVTASGPGFVFINDQGCGGGCTRSFPPGTSIRLSAFAIDPYFSFAGWHGGPCSGLSCSFTLTAPVTVHGTFARYLAAAPAASGPEPPRDTSAPRITRARIVGRTVRFSLSEPATTTATVQRGRRVVARVTTTKRTLTVRTRDAAARITLVATDAAGNRSEAVRPAARARAGRARRAARVRTGG